MSILEEVLIEEYQRSLRTSAALRNAIASLPKGSVQMKRIKGREYPYLQWREGKKVCSAYIHKEDLENVRRAVEQRKGHEKALKEQEESRRMIVRALGRVPE